MKRRTVVVGLQYGDEAKGKTCDYLMSQYDICVRYNGSCNTGATVWVDDKKYKFHHVPVGVLHNKPSYIAPTCLINPKKLLEEITILESQGVSVRDNLYISPHCHAIMPEHIEADIAQEQTSNGVGSTKQGVSPCAKSKYGRQGIRLFETEYAFRLGRYFVDVSYEINNFIHFGFDVLFEGAQGTMLDIDHGIYPFVSTSSNIAGAAPAACGIGPQKITDVIGVIKPYLTYVGSNKCFMTEIGDEQTNNYIAEKGGEYGTTTGRRRRVGWLDIPQLRYAVEVNGVTELCLTKVDVLEGLAVKYCVGYEKKGNHLFIDTIGMMPMLKDLQNYNPIYLEHEKFDLTKLINLLESKLNIPVKYISTSPDRKDMVVRHV